MNLALLEKEFMCEFAEGIHEFMEACLKYEVKLSEIYDSYIREDASDNNYNYLIEDASTSAQDGQKSGIAKVIDAIKKFISTVIQKIKDLFVSKKVQASITSMQKNAKSLPGTKVEVVDMKAVEKINDDYSKKVGDILNSSASPDACKEKFQEVTEKYKKDKEACRAKKVILPIGIAVAAASAAAIGIYKANKATGFGDSAVRKIQSITKNILKKENSVVASKPIKDSKKTAKQINALRNASYGSNAREATQPIVEIVTEATREVAQQASETYNDVNVLNHIIEKRVEDISDAPKGYRSGTNNKSDKNDLRQRLKEGGVLMQKRPGKHDVYNLQDILKRAEEMGIKSESVDDIAAICGCDNIQARMLMIMSEAVDSYEDDIIL